MNTFFGIVIICCHYDALAAIGDQGCGFGFPAFGGTILIVIISGILVALTGTRVIIRAKHPDLFRREMLIHGFSLLAASALGFFAHCARVWFCQGKYFIGVVSLDHRYEAYDQRHIASLDMLVCAVIFIGALLGAIAALRMASCQSPKFKTDHKEATEE